MCESQQRFPVRRLIVNVLNTWCNILYFDVLNLILCVQCMYLQVARFFKVCCSNLVPRLFLLHSYLVEVEERACLWGYCRCWPSSQQVISLSASDFINTVKVHTVVKLSKQRFWRHPKIGITIFGGILHHSKWHKHSFNLAPPEDHIPLTNVACLWPETQHSQSNFSIYYFFVEMWIVSNKRGSFKTNWYWR
jgi:hypothetical protein